MSLLQCGQVDRIAPAHTLERLVDLGLLHHAPRQRRVERRQTERAVLEDFDQRAAGAEQQDRPELRVDAAADDQLVAVELDHRLDGDALEMLRADFLADRRLDALEGGAHGVGVAQIELHAAHVGLVGDGLGIELEHDRIAHLLGACDGGFGVGGEVRLDGRHVVGAEHLLRLVFGQDGAPGAERVLDDARSTVARSGVSSYESIGRIGVS